MMDHNNIQELLSAYANDELARTQREFIEQHLTGCSSCQAELNEYRWVRSAVGLMATVPAESDIKENTMASIETIDPQQEGVSTVSLQGEFWAKIGLNRLPRPALVMAVIAAVVIIPLALQLAGGGSGVGLASAYAATESLQSFRMSGTTVSSFGASTSEVAFDWEFVAPDSYKGRFTSPAGLQEFVIIGDEQYSRSPGNTGAGVTFIEIGIDGYDVFNPVPTRAGTLQILDSLVDVESLADETIDGVSTLHYRGRVDIDRIVDKQAALLDSGAPDFQEGLALLDYQRSMKIEVELWLNSDDSSIRQMKLDSEALTFVSDQDGSRFEGSSTFSTLVKFTDLNAPVLIERPVGENGLLEPGWSLGGGGAAPTIGTELR